jgi:hypothetical protein
MFLSKSECHDINRQELIISLILAPRFLLDPPPAVNPALFEKNFNIEML